MPEPSIARLSARTAPTVYVVGTTTLYRASWDGSDLVPDGDFAATYVSMPGQTYGWDATLALGAAWFLDDGRGTEAYAGSLRGCGTSTKRAAAPGARGPRRRRRCRSPRSRGLPGGIVANPPCVDPSRRIVVAYDSGNGVVAAFRYDEHGRTSPSWRIELDHGCHPILWPDTGEVLVADHDPEAGESIVIVDIETGRRKRVPAPVARSSRCCSARPASPETPTSAASPPSPASPSPEPSTSLLSAGSSPRWRGRGGPFGPSSADLSPTSGFPLLRCRGGRW
ncbi:MAG: hypothetical protein R2701_02640 [Acidimicrobiales bacterium]